MPTSRPRPPARLAPLALALCTLLVLAGCGGEDEAARGPWVVGRWQAQGPQGSSEVSFEREGEGVVLVSDGMRVPVRTPAPGRYEGEAVEGGVTVRFAFERRGEGLHARYTLVTGAGEQGLPDLAYTRMHASSGGPAAGGAGGDAAATRAPWVLGRWQASTDQGTSEVAFEAEGAGVVLVSGGVRAPLRSTGVDRYAGEAVEGEVVLRLAFERRGEQLLARYTVSGAAGEQALPEVVYSRIAAGRGAVNGDGGAAPPTPGDGRAARLVGHWRYTDVLASGGMSLVTDVHLVLEAGGRSRTWSRTEGVGSGSTPERAGRWKLQGDELWLDEGEGWASLGRVMADGQRLMLVRGSSRRVYERI